MVGSEEPSTHETSQTENVTILRRETLKNSYLGETGLRESQATVSRPNGLKKNGAAAAAANKNNRLLLGGATMCT